mmetsp:Transcript_40597/g.36022  ORF Transcript_40597/g.36022 Transcript_40597/m.36022 type:complete len:178 (+) Transcript_40597:257-790(+)
MIYNLFTVVLLLFLLQFLRKMQKETAQRCDEGETTASDFTIRVKGIPKIFTEQSVISDDIREFFETRGLPGETLNVQAVNICYDCQEVEDIEKELKETSSKLKLMEGKIAKGEHVEEHELSGMKSIIQHDKQKLDTIMASFTKSQGVSEKFSGEAYVTFETQDERERVLKFWKLSWW